MQNTQTKIVIIGCGNLAWHLAKKISKKKLGQLYIYNHQNHSNLNLFQEKFGAEVFSNLNSIVRNATYYFICVKDSEIETLSKKISYTSNSLVMHCSGSQTLSVLKKHKNIGVFYPLQTFSKLDKISWSKIPICIQSNSITNSTKMESLAKNFSDKIYFVTEQERIKIHLAAVFTNNFTNALLNEAQKLLPKKYSQNLDLLLPLLTQTVTKLKTMTALEAQTGPAKRRDTIILTKQRAILKSETKLLEVYNAISELILNQEKK